MKLEALFDQLHALPTIPRVAQELILQFDNPSTNIDGLARNIERDPVIAAKVLRLANSVRFHGARDSTSIEDAAMRVGFNMLRTLVLLRWLAVLAEEEFGLNQTLPSERPMRE